MFSRVMPSVSARRYSSASKGGWTPLSAWKNLPMSLRVSFVLPLPIFWKCRSSVSCVLTSVLPLWPTTAVMRFQRTDPWRMFMDRRNVMRFLSASASASRCALAALRSSFMRASSAWWRSAMALALAASAAPSASWSGASFGLFAPTWIVRRPLDAFLSKFWMNLLSPACSLPLWSAS